MNFPISDLLDLALKGSLILGAATFLSLALHKASAALRHLVWFVAVLGILALPLASQLLLARHGSVARRQIAGAQQHAGLACGQVVGVQRHLVALRLAGQIGHQLAVGRKAQLPRDVPPGRRESRDAFETDGAGRRRARA